jgi:DNA-directed RNA polymerase II subunit RPB3
MEPRIQISSEDDNIIKFTLSGVDVSLANAIRRIILSDIPSFVFRTLPYSENKATIHINTSRLNNEIIKQRLSCIPIHINDMDFNYKDYIVEVDVKNDSDTIKIITSEDFKIKNISTDKYLSKESTRKIFPPDPISGQYIDFVRLRPKISDDIDGEHLKMECTLDIGTAKENGSFNVVSCCSYKNTRDPIAQNRAWTEIEQKMRSQGDDADAIDYAKNDWLALEANRYFLPNSFDFTIETIGIFENRELVKIACQIMIRKLEKFASSIEQEPYLIDHLVNTIPNCYEVTLKEDDYTIGKALEYVLYDKYYTEKKELHFCGFRKPHPHISASVIRLGFKEETDKTYIARLMFSIVDSLIVVYRNIETMF